MRRRRRPQRSVRPVQPHGRVRLRPIAAPTGIPRTARSRPVRRMRRSRSSRRRRRIVPAGAGHHPDDGRRPGPGKQAWPSGG